MPTNSNCLWKQTKESKASTVDSLKTGRCGRKKKMCSPNLEILPNVPLSGRGTLRSLSCAIDIPRSTLHGSLKRGEVFRSISSAEKPLTYIERDKAKPRLGIEDEKMKAEATKNGGSLSNMYQNRRRSNYCGRNSF
jgi:hypothetical protein